MAARSAAARRAPVRGTLATATALLGLVACGGATASQPPSPAATSPDADGAVMITVTAALTSESTKLATVGPGTPKVYGWNLLTGSGEFLGAPVSVVLQGSVDYTGGAGPFGGFVTITAPDGGTLAMRLDGQATPAADGGATALDGRLEFIGATGGYQDMVAGGMFHASRADAVGAPVTAALELTVDTDGLTPAAP